MTRDARIGRGGIAGELVRASGERSSCGAGDRAGTGRTRIAAEVGGGDCQAHRHDSPDDCGLANVFGEGTLGPELMELVDHRPQERQTGFTKTCYGEARFVLNEKDRRAWQWVTDGANPVASEASPSAVLLHLQWGLHTADLTSQIIAHHQAQMIYAGAQLDGVAVAQTLGFDCLQLRRIKIQIVAGSFVGGVLAGARPHGVSNIHVQMVVVGVIHRCRLGRHRHGKGNFPLVPRRGRRVQGHPKRQAWVIKW